MLFEADLRPTLSSPKRPRCSRPRVKPSAHACTSNCVAARIERWGNPGRSWPRHHPCCSSHVAATWVSAVGGVVHAPDQPTCYGHVCDFFVVRKAISRAVVGIQRLEDGGLFPHFPARLLVWGSALRYLVRGLCKPTKVQGCFPAGSPSPPPSYDEVRLRITDDPSGAMEM